MPGIRPNEGETGAEFFSKVFADPKEKERILKIIDSLKIHWLKRYCLDLAFGLIPKDQCDEFGIEFEKHYNYAEIAAIVLLTRTRPRHLVDQIALMVKDYEKAHKGELL